MYRENISGMIDDEYACLFIPKNGGLNDYVLSILPEIGIPESSVSNLGEGGKTRATLDDGQTLELLMARGEDIPRRVEELNRRNLPAYGLTGDDLFDEFVMRSDLIEIDKCSTKALNTYDWFDENARFGRPALCLMSKTDTEAGSEARVAVNSKYEFTSRRFIDRYFEGRAKVSLYSGGTEETVLDGTNDCCVEIIYSGKNCEENGLRIIQPVRFSDVVLIGQDPYMLGSAFCMDYGQVEEKKRSPEEDSLTSMLLSDWKMRRNKTGEELLELYSKIDNGCSEDEIVGEIADVLYMINVTMSAEEIPPEKVARLIEKRLK
ncbi:MAG: hypothetical protein R6U32_03035 [Candidatus Woesearchaeota archaeon]